MAGTRRMLTASDRVEISTGLKAGWTITRIAGHIGRDKSVVSREVARNSTRTRGYRMVRADCQAARRRARPQVGKVAASVVLSARVRADLKQGRSPKAIAGRLAAEAADPGLPVAFGAPNAHGERVSHEAVYAYIYALPKGELARHGIMLSPNAPAESHVNRWESARLARSWGCVRSMTAQPRSKAGKSPGIGNLNGLVKRLLGSAGVVAWCRCGGRGSGPTGRRRVGGRGRSGLACECGRRRVSSGSSRG